MILTFDKTIDQIKPEDLDASKLKRAFIIGDLMFYDGRFDTMGRIIFNAIPIETADDLMTVVFGIDEMYWDVIRECKRLKYRNIKDMTILD